VELHGIPLARLWEYLAPGDPMTVREGTGEVLLQYAVDRASSGGLTLALRDGTVRARGVLAGERAGTETWLQLREVEASGIEAAWPPCRLRVPVLRVAEPQVLVRVDTGGGNWARPAAPPAPETEASPTWSAAVGSLEVTGGTVVLDDRIVTPAVTTTFSGLSLRLKDVSTDLTAPVDGELTVSVNGTGKGSVAGAFVPDPLSADLRVALSDVDVTPFQPYSVRLPGAELKKLTAGLTGTLKIGPGTPSVQFEGEGSLRGLQIAGAGEERLLGCEHALLRGVRLTVAPDRLRVQRIDVDGAEFKLHIDKKGNFNLAQLTVEEGAPPATRTPPREPMAVDITRIVFARTGGSFTDESLILPFGTRIHSMHGDVKDFSTRSTAPARLDLEGRVLEEGYFKSSGTLRLADPLAASDINVLFRDVQLPSLTPYSAQFAGYSMQQGMLDLDLRYRLADRKLLGDHHVVAKDLVLGPKVEGAEGPGLPVRLAVALLKDRQGRIDLEVPVEGTVDAPEFNYSSVFWQALKKILGQRGHGPLPRHRKALRGRRRGAGAGGLRRRPRRPPGPEVDKLAKVATELAGSRRDLPRHRGTLRPRHRHRRPASRSPGGQDRRPAHAGDDPGQILEALYAESFSPERLETERLQFAAAGAVSGASFYEAPAGAAHRGRDGRTGGPVGARHRPRPGDRGCAHRPGPSRSGARQGHRPFPGEEEEAGLDLVPSEMAMTAED
jgi:hypothetical protein